LRRHLETGGKKRKSPAADAGSGVDESGLQRTVGTLCADTHPGAYSGQDAYTGRLIPQQKTVGTLCARDYKGVGSQYVQEGKCIPVPVPFRKAKWAQSTTDDETWVEGEVSNTLNNFDLGDTRTTHAVVEPIPIQDGREIEKRQNGLGIANHGDPSYTIDTTGAQAIAIQGTIIGRGENSGPQGTGATQGGPMFTLTKTDIHGVAHTIPGSVAPVAFSFDSLASNSMKSSNPISGCREVDLAKTIDTTNPCPSKNQGGLGILQTPPMAVRRLTPVECERLQGFPDNWSRIPWKGKPEEQCPDGPRYKACGNSMATPCVRWIGQRLAIVDSFSK
jgi:site-specific DNA-cytosine methylase